MVVAFDRQVVGAREQRQQRRRAIAHQRRHRAAEEATLEDGEEGARRQPQRLRQLLRGKEQPRGEIVELVEVAMRIGAERGGLGRRARLREQARHRVGPLRVGDDARQPLEEDAAHLDRRREDDEVVGDGLAIGAAARRWRAWAWARPDFSRAGRRWEAMLRAMAWKKSSQGLIDRFDAVFPGAPAERRLMFGYPAGFVNGNMFMGLYQESLVQRLDDQARRELLDGGAKLFEPMKGRAMKEYVVAPAALLADHKALERRIRQALAFASALPPKAKKPAKRKAKKS